MDSHGVLQELADLPAPDRSRDSVVQEWADCLRNVRSLRPTRTHALHVPSVPSFRQRPYRDYQYPYRDYQYPYRDYQYPYRDYQYLTATFH